MGLQKQRLAAWSGGTVSACGVTGRKIESLLQTLKNCPKSIYVKINT
jgi:hypothetical protein